MNTLCYLYLYYEDDVSEKITVRMWMVKVPYSIWHGRSFALRYKSPRPWQHHGRSGRPLIPERRGSLLVSVLANGGCSFRSVNR